MAEALTAPSLDALDPVAHAFFTRRGGVSDGLYESLNAGRGSKDDPGAVAENRARMTAALKADRLATPYQVHGTRTAIVGRDWSADDPPKADALVTAERSIAIGVVTADCVPVLMADAQAGVAAAVHAGWRGAAAGVLESAVLAMEGLGADRGHVVAAIGPSIAQASYQVGPEVRGSFVAIEPFFRTFFARSKQAGKFLFDLEGAVAGLLATLGVGSVEPLGRDTYADEARFYSYRRATHRGEADYGRQLSAIALA